MEGEEVTCSRVVMASEQETTVAQEAGEDHHPSQSEEADEDGLGEEDKPKEPDFCLESILRS